MHNKKLHLIFDLYGLLINTDSQAQRRLIGTWTILKYLLKDLPRFTLNNARDDYFNFLTNLKAHNPADSIATDNQGITLPQYKCDWLKGTISGQEIIEHVQRALQTSTLDTVTKNIIEKTTLMTFNPTLFIQTRILDKKGFAFATKYKNAGYQLYCITNWDADSFPLLEQKYPQLFALFNDIVVSGFVGMIKPDPKIYTYALDKFGLDARECVFIDDTRSNVIAAYKVGMHGIVCPEKRFLWMHSPDFGPVEAKLRRLQQGD